MAVVGGAKVTDKIGVLEAPQRTPTRSSSAARCASRSSRPRATSRPSLREEEGLEPAKALLGKRKLRLLTTSCRPRVQRRHRGAANAGRDIDVPDGWMGLDIGPRHGGALRGRSSRAGTVFWNGRWGLFELEPSAAGPSRVAEAVAATRGTTVVGGGDSAAALAQFGLVDA